MNMKGFGMVWTILIILILLIVTVAAIVPILMNVGKTAQAGGSTIAGNLPSIFGAFFYR